MLILEPGGWMLSNNLCYYPNVICDAYLHS